MRQAVCLGFYLERFGAKEGKGDLGLRNIHLDVSRLKEGWVEAGRWGRRPERAPRAENRAGPGRGCGGEAGQEEERFVKLSPPQD